MRQGNCNRPASIVCVSIHASVKDATFLPDNFEVTKEVSIHASVKDATSFHSLNQPDFTVSIHASVKDATNLIVAFNAANVSFNPRICKRCDAIYISIA